MKCVTRRNGDAEDVNGDSEELAVEGDMDRNEFMMCVVVAGPRQSPLDDGP